jgi:Ca2+-binding RTX toxin-like protein
LVGTPVTANTPRLVINGLAGNDTISVHGSVHVPIEAHGGSGNDRITGGGGNDVLLGDDVCQSGRDSVTGGMGDDVIVGGGERDNLDGGGGNDVLIAGELVAFDLSFASLRSLGDTWAMPGGTVNADLADSNADGDIVDTAIDALTGGTGRDWLIRNLADRFVDSKRLRGDGDVDTRI